MFLAASGCSSVASYGGGGGATARCGVGVIVGGVNSGGSSTSKKIGGSSVSTGGGGVHLGADGEGGCWPAEGCEAKARWRGGGSSGGVNSGVVFNL